MKSYQDKSKSELIKEIESLKKQVHDFRKTKESLPESIIVDTPESQQTNEKLLDSEEKFRLIGEHTTDFISIIGLDKKYIYASPSYKLLGYDPEELIGSNGFELLHPEDRERMIPVFQQVISGFFKKGATKRFEIRLRDKSGQYYFTESIAKLIKDDSGKFQILSVIRDITKRKQVESEREAVLETLRESEEKYRTLVECSSDLIFLINNKGNVLSVNQAAAASLGIKPNEIQGKNISEIFPEEITQRYKRNLKKVFETGEAASYEGTIPAGEQTLWISTSLNPVIGSAGKVMAVLGVSRDITKRKQTEMALRKSEEKYRLLIDNTDIGFVVIDEEGIVVEANEPYLRFAGANQLEDIIGHSVIEWTAPESKEKNVAAVELCAKQGFIKDFETTYLHKNGTRVNILINAIVHETSGGKRLTSQCRDITKHKQAEEALRESEERYRGVVEDTPVLISCFLPGGEITFVNKAYCEYFTRTPEELVGSTFLSLIPESDRETVMDNISALTVESPTQSHEHQVIAPGGDLRWQRWTIRALFDAQGKVVAYQSIGEDITERKKVEEALIKSEEQFRLIAENTSDNIGITTFDLKAKYLYVSSSVKTLLGYDPEEMLGKSFFDFIHPEDKKALFPLLKKYINLKLKKLLTGKELTISETIEFRIKNKTGNYRFMQSTLNILGNKLLAITRDITERKQTEAEIIEWKHRYESAVQASGHILYDWDSTTNEVTYGGAVEKILGYSMKEMEGGLKRWIELIHPDDVDHLHLGQMSCWLYSTFL